MTSSTVFPILFVVLLVFAGSFAVDVTESQRPDPVAFDDTIRTGQTAAVTAQSRVQRYHIPKAEVFYSQYPYAIGYYGIGSLVDELQRAGHERQFGRPLSVYVTDYAGVDVRLTEDGYLTLPDHPAGYEAWVPAEEAVFVVDSRARTLTGPAVLAFSDRGDARAFVDRFGGQLRDWSALRSMAFGTTQATRASLEASRESRTAWADQTVREARALLDRPVSVVVGENGTTLEAAIRRAEPNSTVVVPPGNYSTNLTLTKPLTLRGAGPETLLHGDGTGSVVRVRSPRVAVSSLRITGVGNETTVESIPGNDTEWDYKVKLGYAYGDAGIVFDRANGSFVHDVTIDTPANGVLFRWSDRSVADGLTVNGGHPWEAGFMGVMDVESRIVVQRSTFRNGRDGVYTHHAHGLVIRDNLMTGMRFGVHEMYTSDALVTNNTVSDTWVGLVVMTRPHGNILADNEVRTSDVGIIVGGSRSSIAGNTVHRNDVGMYVSARRSLYEGNLVVDNGVGLRATELVPTNRVVDNDIVDNDRPTVVLHGPLRLWTGNYWADAPGIDRNRDGALDRAFSPTGPVDGRVGRVPGAATLARSPVVSLLKTLQSLVPGLRATGVVDTAPRASPARPDRLSAVNDSGRR